jgi:hypothetical protein
MAKTSLASTAARDRLEGNVDVPRDGDRFEGNIDILQDEDILLVVK